MVYGLLGAAAGYLLTILPCIWEGYQATHRMDHYIVLFWIGQDSPAAIVPLLVGAFVGQSLAAEVRRQKAPRS